MQCTKCFTPLAPDDKYCRSCGKSVEEMKSEIKTQYCTGCGKQVDDSWENCPFCGKKLNAESKTDTNEMKAVDYGTAIMRPRKIYSADNADTKKCQNCGADMRAVAKFCPKCGADNSDNINSYSDRRGNYSSDKSGRNINTEQLRDNAKKYANIAKESGLDFAENLKNFKNLDKSKKKKTLITCGIIACVVIVLIVALSGGGYVSYQDAADDAVVKLNSKYSNVTYELVSYEPLGQASAKNPMAGDIYHYTAVYLTVKSAMAANQNDIIEENYYALICKENPGADTITDITGESVEEAKKTFNEMKDRMS